MSPIDRDALIEFTRRLVRERSVNRPEDGCSEQSAAELVAEQMRGFGWEPVVDEAAPGRPNVIARLEGADPGPTLMLEGHVDVVTEGDARAWTHPPFAAEIADGRLYGRGAADMKAGVAAMLFAAHALARERFAGTVVVAALVDEEGMMIGVRDFVRRGRARHVDAALVCEPEGGEVCVAQKGAIRLRVDAAGRMAHGAMPHHGDNPIPRLARFLAACSSVQDELQRANREDPYLGWDYITPTFALAGGEAQLNVIPGRAAAGLDVRTTPATDHGRLVERLRAELEPGMTLTVLDDRPPTRTSDDHPLVAAVREAHRRRHGAPPSLGGVPGATDGTILFAEAGIPIVTYGPGGKWIAHQVDEYVDVDELVAYADVYLDAARAYLRGAGAPAAGSSGSTSTLS
jgi:succinyl-diaminopimelate desuccinylase